MPRLHLVERLFAPENPLGRVAWISRVISRVVVADLDIDTRTLGQRDGLFVGVLLLPVEIPVLDP